MAGVHASCVEEWVHRHREFQPGSDPPHCPVCRCRYGGSEVRPGTRIFLRRLGHGCLGQVALGIWEALCFGMLGILLVEYSHSFATDPTAEGLGGCTSLLRSASDELFRQGENIESHVDLRDHRPHALPRWAAAAGLCTLLLYKAMILLASLPPGRMRPAARIAQPFFTGETWYLARHTAEVSAAVMLLGFRWAKGDLAFLHFLPICIIASVPALPLLQEIKLSVCIREVAIFVGFVAGLPILFAAHTADLLYRYRWRLLNPWDGPVHLLTVAVALLLNLVFRSRSCVTKVYVAHSVVLSIGLLERVGLFARLTSRRRRWIQSSAWWCAMLVAIETTSLTLDRRWITLLLLLIALRGLQRAAANPEPHQDVVYGTVLGCTLLVLAEGSSLILREVRGAPFRDVSAEVAAVVWLGLLFLLTCAVNWRRCRSAYSAWQRRNATFVLCTNSDNFARSVSISEESDEGRIHLV